MSESSDGPKCPHCGGLVNGLIARPLGEVANGRRVAIAWMIHLGWQMKDIAIAFGVKPPSIHQVYKKIRKGYARNCNFIDWRLSKHGKKVLKGFYRDGKYYSICEAGEYFQYLADGERDWDGPKIALPVHALHEVWRAGARRPEMIRVFDLGDWAQFGFVFNARSK